jgi:hypothetical protein
VAMQELSKESQRQRKTHSMIVILNVQHETLARTEVGLNDTSVEFRVEWNLEGQGCRVASRPGNPPNSNSLNQPL